MAALLILSLAACGEQENDNNDKGNSNTAKEYYLTYNGVKLEVGGEAAALLSKLGNPEGEIGEACGTDERDVIYALSGVEIETHVSGQSEIVRQIKITNDSQSTQKGITIGSSRDDVVKAYGNGYKEGSSGALRYEGGSSAIEVHFGVSGNVSNIYIKKK